MLYTGANEQGKSRVGIILDKEWKEKLVSVKRKNDRVMSFKIAHEDRWVNIVCTYDPQGACGEEEKEDFGVN